MKSEILLLAALGFGGLPASAQDVPSALERCAAIGDDHARLSCYDGLAAGFKHATAPASQPAPQAAVPPPVAAPLPAPAMAAKTADFGADTIRKDEPAQAAPDEVDEVKGTVTQVVFSSRDRFTVTLDNGQVWRQLDADTTARAPFHKSGDAVTISRGVLGSYNLTLDEHGVRLFKVRRVR